MVISPLVELPVVLAVVVVVTKMVRLEQQIKVMRVETKLAQKMLVPVVVAQGLLVKVFLELLVVTEELEFLLP